MSLISLVVLSYDRYSTLTVYHKRGPDYRKPLLAVGGSWLYSLIWTVPPLLGWSSYGLEGAGTSCSVSWTQRTAQSHAYIICLFIFCLGLPVLIMVYCYGRLLYAVKQVNRIFCAVCQKTAKNFISVTKFVKALTGSLDVFNMLPILWMHTESSTLRQAY